VFFSFLHQIGLRESLFFSFLRQIRPSRSQISCIRQIGFRYFPCPFFAFLFFVFCFRFDDLICVWILDQWFNLCLGIWFGFEGDLGIWFLFIFREVFFFFILVKFGLREVRFSGLFQPFRYSPFLQYIRAFFFSCSENPLHCGFLIYVFTCFYFDDLYVECVFSMHFCVRLSEILYFLRLRSIQIWKEGNCIEVIKMSN